MDRKNDGYNLGTKLNVHRITHEHKLPSTAFAFFKTQIKGLKKKNIYIYTYMKQLKLENSKVLRL